MFTFLYKGKNARYKIGITSDSAVYAGDMYLIIVTKVKTERIYIDNFTEGLNEIACKEGISFNDLLNNIGLHLE